MTGVIPIDLSFRTSQRLEIYLKNMIPGLTISEYKITFR